MLQHTQSWNAEIGQVAFDIFVVHDLIKMHF